METSQSRSTFEVSSRHSRITKEAKSKAQAHIAEQQRQQPHDQSRPIVRDPETDKDCTPQPLVEKSKGGKIGVKRPHGSQQPGVSQVSGDSRDRRPSLPSFSNVESSQGGGSTNERSISRAHESSEGTSEISGISDDTGGLFDDSSDSHSTHDRSSEQSSFYHRHGQSHISSDGTDSRQGHHHPSSGGASSSQQQSRRSDQPLLKDFIVRTRPTKEYTPEEFRAWRQEEVILTLQETPVMMLFSRNDELVPNDDSEEAEAVRRNNERYDAYCKARADGESGGRYASTGVTTLNDPCVSENHFFEPPEKVDAGGIQVTTWKLHDALEKTAAQLAAASAEEAGISAADADTSVTAGGAGEDEGREGGIGDDEVEEEQAQEEGGGGGGQNTAEKQAERKKNAWKRSHTLAENLMIVERCVVQTIFDELQVLYRGLPYDKLTDLAAIPESPSKTTRGTDHFSKGGTMGATMVSDSMAETKKGLGVTKRGGGDANNATITSNTNNETISGAAGTTTTTNVGGGGGPGGGLSVTQQLGATQMMMSTSTQQQMMMMSGTTGSGASSIGREKMKILWRYSDTNLTKNRTVSCMSYNKVNTDILAAGYNGGGQSIICCWSLKNPTAPERTIIPPSDAAITSMHFGNQNGSLLAVGTTDGMISLYDVRKHGNAPALKSTVSSGQHTGTVWETRWVEKGKDRDEALISISADGWVKEWSIKKGLERVGDLIRLKRVVNRERESAGAAYGGTKGKTREALLSRQSGGMCFDMNPVDPMIYVVGTEDGTISKCTKSKDDNTIFDYAPHDEPVYRIRWSPFNSQYFLTCSADWTSRLYHIDKHDPIMTFDSNRQDPVQDLAWSPHCSSIFGCVTSGGRVEVWDIADPLQARAVFEMNDRSLSCLLFADQESPVVTTGDNKGDVTVMKVSGLEFERNMMTDAEQEQRLADLVRKQ